MSLIDDLKNEGYDTSQITPELISTLQKEGYDTSALNVPAQPDSKLGTVKKVWDAAHVPAEMAEKGFNELSNLVPQPEPTGNLPLDVLKGAPSALAKTALEGAGKISSSFITPEAAIGGAVGKGIGAVAKTAPVQKLAKGAGNLVAKGVEKFTGINPESTAAVFKNPTKLVTAPTKGAVEKAYANSELTKVTETIDDIVEAATSGDAASIRRAGNILRRASPADKIKAGQKLLEGRKALDAQIEGLRQQARAATGKGKSALIQKMRAKYTMRTKLNEALDDIAPKHRAADAVASQQAEVDTFRNLTLPGKVRFDSLEGVMRAVPGLPQVAGGVIGAAGGAAQTAGFVAKNIGQEAALVEAFRRLTNKKKKKG